MTEVTGSTMWLFRLLVVVSLALSLGQSATSAAVDSAVNGAPAIEQSDNGGTAPSAETSARHRICDSLAFVCPLVKSLYWSVMTEGSPIHWLYLLSALLIASAVYLFTWKHSGERRPNILRFLFPKQVWLGKSALTDYQFYLSTVALGLFISFSSLLLSIATVSEAVQGLLTAIGGVQEPTKPALDVIVLYMLLNVAAVDFGFFFAHYLNHRIPVLWEFHKVHHAAESLTVFTAFRFHPVDIILTGFFIGLVAGTVDGCFSYALGGTLPAHLKVFNYSVILIGINLVENLRHSHVWLSYGWHVSHVLSSPAQHQIHHSCEERHIDKNFAQMFSLWDWAFGTLYIPREKESFLMGLSNAEHRQYYSLWGCYVRPVVKASRLMGAAGKSLLAARRPRHS